MATRKLENIYGEVTVSDNGPGYISLWVENDERRGAGVTLNPDQAKELSEILAAFAVVTKRAG